MFRFILQRLGGLIFVFFGVTLFTFGIAQLVPVDPAAAALGANAREEQIAAYRAQLGLDRPVYEQYVLYMQRLLMGDLGDSVRTRRAVVEDLRDFLPATIELSVAAMGVALLFGIPLGILAALRRNQLPDALARLFALLGSSMPIFYVGLLALGWFYRTLQWLPGGGRLDAMTDPPQRITGLFTLDSLLTGDWATFADAVYHLFLPALVLGLFSMAVLLRITRSSMLEALSQDYVRTARAKGLSERFVVLRHVFKNALPPVLTATGIVFGSLLSGAVLTETVFGWPGLGKYATTSVRNLDLPAVMGVTLVAAFIYPLVNTLVDIGYHLIDPRVRMK